MFKKILISLAALGVILAGAGLSLAATGAGTSSSSSVPPGQLIRLCVNDHAPREVKQPQGTGRCPRGYFIERFNKNLHPMPGPQGPTGKTGAPGVENVTVPFAQVTTAPYDPSSIPAGQTGTFITTCSSGQVAFSGGYALPSSESLVAVQDKPTWYGLTNPKPTTTPASGWEVVVQNTGTSAASTSGVNVWAVCGTLDSTSSGS